MNIHKLPLNFCAIVMKHSKSKTRLFYAKHITATGLKHTPHYKGNVPSAFFAIHNK